MEPPETTNGLMMSIRIGSIISHAATIIIKKSFTAAVFVCCISVIWLKMVLKLNSWGIIRYILLLYKKRMIFCFDIFKIYGILAWEEKLKK